MPMHKHLDSDYNRNAFRGWLSILRPKLPNKAQNVIRFVGISIVVYMVKPPFVTNTLNSFH